MENVFLMKWECLLISFLIDFFFWKIIKFFFSFPFYERNFKHWKKYELFRENGFVQYIGTYTFIFHNENLQEYKETAIFLMVPIAAVAKPIVL